MLTGRAEQLRILDDAVTEASSGRGRLVVVSGEAGIGKSTLAEAAAKAAEARGVTVTRGRAWEFADAPPYFPVRPCLRALGLDDRAHADDAFQLWESLIAAIARSAESAPMLWIVEDVHAADLGTLDLLAFLAQPLRAMRALVVVTVRANDPRLGTRVTQRIARMERDGLSLRLASLSDEDVAALAESTLGRTIGTEARKRLVDLTGGNPLFVIECARVFRTAGGAEGTIDALPATVRQVILERVELLPDATRATLACGAVLGREFSAAPAARMQDTLPARAIDTLLPALRAGLVVEVAPGRFLFSHGIVRDAIEGALPARERAEKHARAEAALSGQGNDGDAIDVVVERARHAVEALPEIDGGRVQDLVGRASEMLERERAFERAFDLRLRLDRARVDGMLPAPSIAQRLELAALARAAGRSDITRRECEHVFVAARAARDAQSFGRAALLLGADVRPGVVDRTQVALIEEALSMLDADPSSATLRCRVRARYATALQPAPDQPAVIAIAERALAEARETSDEHAVRDVLEQMPWGLYAAPLHRRIELMTELSDRARRAEDIAQALRAYAALALYRVEAGDFPAFGRETDTMLALSREVGHPRDRWRPLLLASMRALSLGEFAESDRHVTEVGQLAGLVDDTSFPLGFAMHEVFRLQFQRRDEEARAALAEAEKRSFDIADTTLHTAVLRAACAGRAEDVEGARRAIAPLRGLPSLMWADPNFVVLLAEAYALAGTDDERRTMRAKLVSPEGEDVTTGPVAYVYEGTATRLVGLIDASLGDFEQAERRLSEAHARAVERGHLPWVAQTAYELAKIVARTPRSAEARAWATKARDLARELGMPGLEKSAGAMLDDDGAERKPAMVARPSYALERSDADWAVTFGGRTMRVKHNRGMELLARLVGRPDEEIHVLALASDEGTSAPSTDAGDQLDARAVAEYRERIADLDDEIAEAERLSDTGRLAKRREEREALVAELARAVGLGGRRRAAASASERARVNVQRRLKDAFARIAEVDAAAGRFFERAVKTGTFCCFRP